MPFCLGCGPCDPNPRNAEVDKWMDGIMLDYYILHLKEHKCFTNDNNKCFTNDLFLLFVDGSTLAAHN